MSQTETAVAAVQNQALRAYPLQGALSGVVSLRDKNENVYLRGTFEYVKKADMETGKVSVTTAMVFGRAVADVGDGFKDGPAKLYGAFDKGVFRVVGQAWEPKVSEDLALAA